MKKRARKIFTPEGKPTELELFDVKEEEHEEHDDDEQLKHENKPRLLVAAIVRGGGARARLVLSRDRVSKMEILRWKCLKCSSEGT